MEIGICCGPKETVGLPAGAFDFLEVNVQSFLAPEKEEAEFRAQMEEGAIRPIKSANCFLPGKLKCVGPDVDMERLTRYAETAFRRAAEARMEVIVFGSGAARMAPDGYARERAMEDFCGALRCVGLIAQRHGLTVVVEPLNRKECNLVNSLAEGAEAVERCNHPNVRLLADFYHMLMEGEPATEIARYGHMLGHTHVAELAGRGFPGKGGEDFRPFFRALRESSYKGRIAIECKSDDIGKDVEGSTRYPREQMF